MPRVLHYKINHHKDAVYIGRGSRWGNPYSHKEGTTAQFKVDTVEEAIEGFRKHLEENPQLKEDAKKQLRGKDLSCWCKTLKNPDAPCHGDILLEIANQ